MATTESRYNVTITLDIEDTTTGGKSPFSRTIQQYFDMNYATMVECEVTAIKALLEALSGLGIRNAEQLKSVQTRR